MVLRVEPVEKEDLESFQQQLALLPDKIQEKRNLLSSIEKELTRLHLHKQELAQDLQQARSKLRAAEARQKVLETQDMLQQLRERKILHKGDPLSLDALDATIQVQELELLTAQKDQGDLQSVVIRPELEVVKKDASQTLWDHQKSERELFNTIHDKETQRNTVKAELEGLENSYATISANSIVYRFTQEPHQLIAGLKVQVIEQINAINKLFPARQPERLRLVLAQLPGMLTQIYAQVPSVGLPAERAQKYRQAFYECCGLLYELVEFAGHENLRKRITELLNGYGVNQERASQAYQRNKIELQTAQEFDLKQHEQEAYASAAKALTDWLQEHEEEDSLKRRTQALMDALNKSENEEKFDRPYYTQFLKDTLAAVKNPANKEKRDQYRSTLREMPDGKPSTVRKILGCGLVLLGVLIFVGSALAKCLTLGIAAPITITGLVGGSLLVAAGIGLFAAGCGRGNYKKGKALEAGLEKTAHMQKKLS